MSWMAVNPRAYTVQPRLGVSTEHRTPSACGSIRQTFDVPGRNGTGDRADLAARRDLQQVVASRVGDERGDGHGGVAAG